MKQINQLITEHGYAKILRAMANHASRYAIAMATHGNDIERAKKLDRIAIEIEQAASKIWLL